MTDPSAPREVGVTLKFPESARYKADNPWITFRGTPESIRESIVAVMGWTAEDTNDLTLAALVYNAQRDVTAIGSAGNGLGGRVISEGKASGPAWEEAKSSPAEPAAPEKSAEELAVERLTAEVAKVADVAELQQLWARNQEAFKNEGLMAAYKARGKALSA